MVKKSLQNCYGIELSFVCNLQSCILLSFNNERIPADFLTTLPSLIPALMILYMIFFYSIQENVKRFLLLCCCVNTRISYHRRLAQTPFIKRKSFP